LRIFNDRNNGASRYSAFFKSRFPTGGNSEYTFPVLCMSSQKGVALNS
jgi:hypothetical protein